MEIFDQQTGILQANISSKYPVFTVNGLDSGKMLKIIIYAINVKGRSDAVMLEAYTLKAAEKQTGKWCYSAVVTYQLALKLLAGKHTTLTHSIATVFLSFSGKQMKAAANWKFVILLHSCRESSLWLCVCSTELMLSVYLNCASFFSLSFSFQFQFFMLPLILNWKK